MEALRFGREIRWLFLAALLIFVVTIALGMARGLGILDFRSENQVFTHLHSGVVGWITLGILAAGLWLYGGNGTRQREEPWVTTTTGVLIIAVPLFIVAWWIDTMAVLALTGSLVLLGIVGYVIWLLREARRIGYRALTTPQLGVLVGVVTLVVGSTFGVLIAIGEGSGLFTMPEAFHGAHAETQISAYLILVAMSLAYWRLHGNDRTRGGTWMVWLFFAGGATVAIAILANVLEASVLYIPLDLAAFGILLAMCWRQIIAPGWLQADSRRHYAIAIPFALVYLAVFIYLIVGYAVLKRWASFEEIPPSLIAASSHPLFVGMITNTLFGLLMDLAPERRSVWPWADHVAFWGVSISVAVFTVAILLEAEAWFGIISAALGLSLVIGIGAHLLRLMPRVSGQPAPMPVS